MNMWRIDINERQTTPALDKNYTHFNSIIGISVLVLKGRLV